MIKKYVSANELTIGNYVQDFLGTIYKVDVIGHRNNKNYIQASSNKGMGQNEFYGIPLSEELLLKCEGFQKLPNFNIQNNIIISVGRDRVLTVACVGTPNEMVFLTEEEGTKVKSVFVLRNYDYDGKTYLHDI